MSELSAEARARIKAEAAAIRDRVMNPQNYPQPVYGDAEEPEEAPVRPRRKRAKKASPTGLKRGENLRARRPTYDHDQIIELFKSGKRVTEIAKIVGAHRMTVSRVLNKFGFDPAERKGGPTRRDVCARNHDMSVHGKPVKSGGRYCSECRRVRERGELKEAS